MNILVIGATGGFIGTQAVRKLAAAGHSITVFHRGRTNADLPPGVRHIFGDREKVDPKQFDYAAEDALMGALKKSTS